MYLSRQIRTLALGAAMTMSVVGMPALHALAAAPQGSVPFHGTRTPVVTAALSVQGGATGQGTATDEDCQILAGTINGLLDQAQVELNTKGMTAHWNNLVGLAQQIQDHGEDAGCFFVNPV